MAENQDNMVLSPGQIFYDQRVLRIPWSALKIATWNVRSLFIAGKLDNVDIQIKRLKFDILDTSDDQWSGACKCNTENGVIYYSGNNNSTHRYGVVIIISKNINRAVTNVIPLCDRIMMIQLQTNQVYAHTADIEESEINKFYADIEEVLKMTKKQQFTIVMGDFNAKIGRGKGHIGEHGLGEHNKRGDHLVQFSQTENFIVANTFFKLPKRLLYTWKSPLDKRERIVRNQIEILKCNFIRI
ncbi:hypothetical protein J437_LFUL007752 [Ladona fulva]|uniref:Craniofacial development protein 2-like n=1 Tax=Ladona fulva TaxID=123851 RepID=A0A8K0P393_LADFU|nr:hypothetical protein J437_LFUL007752 [Ladona fulva]